MYIAKTGNSRWSDSQRENLFGVNEIWDSTTKMWRLHWQSWYYFHHGIFPKIIGVPHGHGNPQCDCNSNGSSTVVTPTPRAIRGTVATEFCQATCLAEVNTTCNYIIIICYLLLVDNNYVYISKTKCRIYIHNFSHYSI